jgi:hypothetical protein
MADEACAAVRVRDKHNQIARHTSVTAQRPFAGSLTAAAASQGDSSASRNLSFLNL